MCTLSAPTLYFICKTRGTVPTYHTGWLCFVEDRTRQLARVAHTEPGLNSCSVFVSFLPSYLGHKNRGGI